VQISSAIASHQDSPNPSPAGECAAPPPLVPGGAGHTRLQERGRENPNSDEGTYTVLLYLYTYFVRNRNPSSVHIYHGFFVALNKKIKARLKGR
jgi:hypothetical protein